jgi:hypothetical protein
MIEPMELIPEILIFALIGTHCRSRMRGDSEALAFHRTYNMSIVMIIALACLKVWDMYGG